ncbi:unnamed protein product [Aphanomyces euteiches]
MEEEPWQRTLEHVPGVQGLNKSEIRKDVKEVEQLLEEQRQFAEKHQDDKPQVVKEEADEDVALARRRRQQHLANLYLNKPMPKKKRSRGREVMSAEEIIETLPICRRAVRLTQAELAAVKKERLDLEDRYLKLRSSFIHELEMMLREEKDQQRVMLRIRKTVGTTAKKLLSTKRRNTAMQDILIELESRGDSIEKLQHQAMRMTKILELHGISLSTILVGDTISCQDGTGVVEEVQDDTLTVKFEDGESKQVDKDAVKLKQAPISSFTDDEMQLKARYFEKAGEWISAETALKELLEAHPELEDEWEDLSDEEEEEEDAKETSSTDPPPPKKAKKLIPYKACTLPSTPYEVPLRISPLSELPDHVAAAAAGPSDVQWMGMALPQDLLDWENDRMEALKMKGEIERLKFQLRQAEAQKKDAQNHVNVQLESINKLVSQLEKQREATAAATALLNAAKDMQKTKKQPVTAALKKKERKDSISESNSTPASPMPKQDDASGDEEGTAEDEDKVETNPRRTLRSSKSTPAPSPPPKSTTSTNSAPPDDKATTSSSNGTARRKKDDKKEDKKDDSEQQDKSTNSSSNGNSKAAPTTRRMSSRSKATVKSPLNKLEADASENEEEPEPASKRRAARS